MNSPKVGNTLISKIPNKDHTADNRYIHHSFRLHSVSLSEVFKILKDIYPNKSTGPDIIFPKVIINVADIITEPMNRLSNLCFVNNVNPENFKMADEFQFTKKMTIE